MRHPGAEYAVSAERAIARVIECAEPNDVILTLGAGSVSQIAPILVERLRAHQTNPV
jgi:UDP-N-acetylmuramate--alanine ligase